MPISAQNDKLISAITNNDLKQAYLAIKDGAEVNCFFFRRFTDTYTRAESDYLYALHYAASLGSYDMVTLLLENGAYRHSRINLISDEVNESVTAAIIARRCGNEEIYNLIATWTPRKARVTKRIAADLQHKTDQPTSHQALHQENKPLADTASNQTSEIACLKAMIENLTRELASRDHLIETTAHQSKNNNDESGLLLHPKR